MQGNWGGKGGEWCMAGLCFWEMSVSQGHASPSSPLLSPANSPGSVGGLAGPGACNNSSYGPSRNIRWKRSFLAPLNELPAKTWAHLTVCSQVLCPVHLYAVASDEIFRASIGSLSLPHSLINTPQCILKLRFCLCFPHVITHDSISVYL